MVGVGGGLIFGLLNRKVRQYSRPVNPGGKSTAVNSWQTKEGNVAEYFKFFKDFEGIYDCVEGEYMVDGASTTIPSHVTRAPRSLSRALPTRPLMTGPGALMAEQALAKPTCTGSFEKSQPTLADIYDRVTAAGVPNYRGARVPVPSALNIGAWRRVEDQLEDVSLVDCLEFGFPVGFEGTQPPDSKFSNHTSARVNPHHVSRYLNTEIGHGAMVGPFAAAPFNPWFRTNPAMTRPKCDSTDLRVILDVSYPQGNSVNRGSLDGAAFKLRLPSPLDLAGLIHRLGKGCLMFKVDLSRAYRQLRSDPFDWPLLGIEWDDQISMDTEVPFGLRHGASTCQRTMEAVGGVSRVT